MSTNMDEEERQLQRLKAAVHHTVGRLCQSLGENHQMEFSRQVIAAISETTFRQCDVFAKDLEAFASMTSYKGRVKRLPAPTKSRKT
uniref:Centromere protein S n=1 Tax=Esox lucius TaxID=8010 RepID=A0AAY5KL16_ESOLU